MHSKTLSQQPDTSSWGRRLSHHTADDLTYFHSFPSSWTHPATPSLTVMVIHIPLKFSNEQLAVARVGRKPYSPSIRALSCDPWLLLLMMKHRGELTHCCPGTSLPHTQFQDPPYSAGESSRLIVLLHPPQLSFPLWGSQTKSRTSKNNCDCGRN